MVKRIALVGMAWMVVGCEQPTHPAAGPEDGARRVSEGVRAGADSDRAALEALYEATGGGNWKDDTNWGTDADLDDWYGVETYSDGRVSDLLLRDNNLSGELPGELGDLDAVAWMLFGDNPKLSGSIPPELGKLSSLTWLEFWKNSVSGTIPPELGDADALRTLTIAYTSVEGGIPPELGQLSLLRSLDLRHNKNMSGEIPPELGKLSSLEILYLINTGLTGDIPPDLGAISTLRWLHLGSNDLTGRIPSKLGELTGLEDLYLVENALSGAVPSSLGDLGALSRLHLSRNKLTGALPSTFLNLRLDEFSMWGNAGVCAPATSAFRSWMKDMEFPDYHVNRSLCSEDREALLGLHDALDGSNWTDSNWGSDTDIRSWRGVTLDSDVRVTELRLGDSGLSGELPTVLAEIDKLKVLVLEGNGLVGEVPEAVMELDLDVFWWSDNPGLCIPDTEAFRTWLGDMRSISGPICGH